jgi:hypothetical protein
MTTSLSSLPFTFGANKPNSSLANSSPNRLSRLWGTLISERGFSLLSRQAINAGPFFKVRCDAWSSFRHYIENEVGIGLVRHIDRYLNGGIAAGIMIDSRATHDREWDSFTSTEESSTVGQALA